MSTILQTESSVILEDPEKTSLGPVLGHNLGHKTDQADIEFEAARFRVPDRHRSTNDDVMNSERGALVRGSDPP